MNNNDFDQEEGRIEVDEETGYVILREPDGSEHGFFIECKLELDGVDYVVLIPEGEEDEEDAVGVVFRIEEEDDDSETWLPIEDEDEFQKIVDALDEYLEEEY